MDGNVKIFLYLYKCVQIIMALSTKKSAKRIVETMKKNRLNRTGPVVALWIKSVRPGGGGVKHLKL